MGKKIILTQESEAIQYLCAKDKRLAKVIRMLGDMTYELHEDVYAFLVQEIIEQMLTIKAAQAIFNRLKALCSGEVTPERVQALSDEELRGIGTSESKVKYIRGLTEAVLDGSIDLGSLQEMSDDEVLKKLTSLHGIGTWTAKMVLIFVLDRQDVLPYEDVAFLQGYEWMYKTNDRSPAAVKKRCRKWSPYTSIAARYLYDALDEGLTKKPFHLFKEI